MRNILLLIIFVYLPHLAIANDPIPILCGSFSRTALGASKYNDFDTDNNIIIMTRFESVSWWSKVAKVQFDFYEETPDGRLLYADVVLARAYRPWILDIVNMNEFPPTPERGYCKLPDRKEFNSMLYAVRDIEENDSIFPAPSLEYNEQYCIAVTYKPRGTIGVLMNHDAFVHIPPEEVFKHHVIRMPIILPSAATQDFPNQMPPKTTYTITVDLPRNENVAIRRLVIDRSFGEESKNNAEARSVGRTEYPAIEDPNGDFCFNIRGSFLGNQCKVYFYESVILNEGFNSPVCISYYRGSAIKTFKSKTIQLGAQDFDHLLNNNGYVLQWLDLGKMFKPDHRINVVIMLVNDGEEILYSSENSTAVRSNNRGMIPFYSYPGKYKVMVKGVGGAVLTAKEILVRDNKPGVVYNID